MNYLLRTENLSKWYGNILGVSDLSLEIGSGITGLLGPNGAGKSTFMKLAAGQLKPSLGSITIAGAKPFANHEILRIIGFFPEHDAIYQNWPARDFVRFNAGLHGLSVRQAETESMKALALVGLEDVAERKAATFSFGMKQRLRLAACLVHDPDVFLLDEPLRGIDPLWRIRISDLIRSLAANGKTVLISTHVLPELEHLTEEIVLIHQGKVFASGNVHYIRSLLDRHPHLINVISPDARLLAAELICRDPVNGVEIEADGKTLSLRTENRDLLYRELTRLVVEKKLAVEELSSQDDNLQSVFDYLTGRRL